MLKFLGLYGVNGMDVMNCDSASYIYMKVEISE